MIATCEHWPTLSLPPAEAARLKDEYLRAKVILEYGSGGSTVLAAQMPGKLVYSVESDWSWAVRLQDHIDTEVPNALATVYHVDIGPTGGWGRPQDSTYWHRYHRYPLVIWDEPFFRHPDVVLIDGRFRAACMVAVMMRINRHVTVLFDDYVERLPYHTVEHFVKPRDTIGRMAVFDVKPGLLGTDGLIEFNEALAQITHAGTCAYYDNDASRAIEMRLKARER